MNTDVAAVYREFTDALTEVLAENAVGPARRGRLARAHATVKRHPEYSERGFCIDVEARRMTTASILLRQHDGDDRLGNRGI